MTFPDANVNSVLNKVEVKAGQVILAKLVVAATDVARNAMPTVTGAPPVLKNRMLLTIVEVGDGPTV